MDVKAEKMKTGAAATDKPLSISHSKNSTFVVDISRGLVRVTKTSKTGVILSAGQAPFTVSQLSSQDVIDAQFATSVASAIKQACLRAEIKGFSKKAVFLVGDAFVISRLFTWPSIPNAAMRANAELEISTFLPQSTAHYTISYEVQKSYINDEGNAVVDVLVAAIPTIDAISIAAAAKLAGVGIERMDIRENARLKAVSFYLDKGSEPFKSYVVLDVSRPQISLTICMNGRYYEKRYFGSDGRPELGSTMSFAPQTHVDIHEDVEEMSAKTGLSNSERFWGLSLSRFDGDTLISEVSAMIDYINYHEKNTPLEGLLLIDPAGTLLPKIETALTIPVYDIEKFVKPELVSKQMYGFNVSPVLDACGALLVSNQTSKAQVIDLKAGSGFDNSKRRLAAKILMAAAAFALLAVFGVARPLMTERTLQNEHDSKVVELSERRAALLGKPALLEEYSLLQEEYNETIVDPALEFLIAYPQALSIIPFIFEIDGVTVRNISASGDTLSISGSVSDLDSFTVLVEYLQNSEIVYNINLYHSFESFVHATVLDDYGVEVQHWTTEFSISIVFS